MHIEDPARPAAHAPSIISARIDRLPPSGPIWSWLAIVSFGAFFEIYETALTSVGLPESPRWLAEQNRGEEADAILCGIEAKVSQRISRPLPPIESIPAGPADGQRGYAALFQGQLRRRTLMLIIGSCAITVGYFGFSNWLPSLLQARGIEVSKSLGYTALIGLSYPLAPYLFSFFADRIERKWQIVAGMGITVVSGLLFAIQTTIAGWVALGLVITVANNLAGYSSHTYRSELYPTALRARGIGLVYSLDRLAAAFSSYLIGFIFVRAGVSGVLVCVAGAAVLAMCVIGLLGPRTRGLATEAIRN